MAGEIIYEGVQEVPEELMNEKDRVLDEGEQDLEEEARRMLDSWNLNKILDEATGKINYDSVADNEIFNAYDGETSFEDLKKEMTPMQGLPGIWYKMVEENKAGERVKPNSTVLYDQVGYLEYSLGPFDSSLNSGKPTFLDLNGSDKNRGRAVMAWEVACFTSLREGEVAKFLIHPSMAYGPDGSPPVVPPDSYLYYTVKIHKTWMVSKLDEYNYIENCVEGFKDTNIINRLEAWEDHKRIAGNYLRDGLTKEALVRYRAAINSIQDFEEANPMLLLQKENREIVDVRFKPLKYSLLVNAAIVANMRSMPSLASKLAFEAKMIDPTKEKAYYQLIKARLTKGDFLRARKYFEEASKNCTKKSCFNSLKLEMDFMVKDDKAKTNELLKKMASALSL